ncbi:MAG: hypothetical protein DRO39_06670 [Thermoprotei archaeon]|nr:MAG: hypothetical protein DRO39_06670 [Thermoprotei archaeon]
MSEVGVLSDLVDELYAIEKTGRKLASMGGEPNLVGDVERYLSSANDTLGHVQKYAESLFKEEHELAKATRELSEDMAELFHSLYNCLYLRSVNNGIIKRCEEYPTSAWCALFGELNEALAEIADEGKLSAISLGKMRDAYGRRSPHIDRMFGGMCMTWHPLLKPSTELVDLLEGDLEEALWWCMRMKTISTRSSEGGMLAKIDRVIEDMNRVDEICMEKYGTRCTQLYGQVPLDKYTLSDLVNDFASIVHRLADSIREKTDRLSKR